MAWAVHLIALASAASPWAEPPGRFDVRFSDFAVDSADPSRVYARGGDRLWASYRGGDGWRPVGDLPGASALGLDPARPGMVFRSVAGVVLESADGGVSWRAAAPGTRVVMVDGRRQVTSDPVFGSRPNDVWLRDPQDPRTLYVGGRDGVLASADGGGSWEARVAWLEQKDVRELLLDPEHPQHIAALSGSSGSSTRWLHDSTNGGRIWTPLTISGRAISHLAGFGAGALAVADLEGWLFRWDGKAWTDLKYRCEDPSRLGDGRIVCQADGDLSVVRLGSGVEELARWRHGGFAPDVARLREQPDGSLLAFTAPFPALSSRDGSVWTKVADRTLAAAVDLAVEPSSSTRFLAARSGVQMLRPPATGWDERDRRGGASVLVDPGRALTLLVGTTDGEVLRSTDLGFTFQAVRVAANGITVATLESDPSGSGILWAGTLGAGVLRSQDGGVTWLPAGKGVGPAHVRRLALDPVRPDAVWAASLAGGLQRTEDAGATWRKVDVGCHVVYDVALDPVRSEVVTVGCEDGLVRQSVDGGTAWGTLEAGLRGDVLTVYPWKAKGGRLVLGTTHAEVAVQKPEGGWALNREDADLAVLSAPERAALVARQQAEALAKQRAAEAERARQEAERRLAEEREAFVAEQTSIKQKVAETVFFDDDNEHGVFTSRGGLWYTADGGELWAPLRPPSNLKFFSAAVLDGGRTVVAWLPGKGLVYRSDLGGDALANTKLSPAGWTVAPTPTLALPGCERTADPAGSFYVYGQDGAVALYGKLGSYWFYAPTMPPAAWYGRAANCNGEGMTTRPPESGSGAFHRVASLLSGEVPAELTKAVRALKGKPAAAWALDDGSSVVATAVTRVEKTTSGEYVNITAIAEIGHVVDQELRTTGTVPANAVWITMTTGAHPVVYVGTTVGVKASEDFGATWESL